MGYKTDYRLEVDSPKLQPISLWIFKDEVIDDYDSSFEEFFEDLEGCEQEDYPMVAEVNGIKWYDHEDDMRKISQKWMGYVFKLYGRGEDGEEFMKYFFNGKVQDFWQDDWTPPPYDLDGEWR